MKTGVGKITLAMDDLSDPANDALCKKYSYNCRKKLVDHQNQLFFIVGMNYCVLNAITKELKNNND